jgi:hypothetical protein
VNTEIDEEYNTAKTALELEPVFSASAYNFAFFIRRLFYDAFGIESIQRRMIG